MLHIIRTPDDPFIQLIKDDPVRPEIAVTDRITDHAEIFLLLDHTESSIVPEPQAMVCCAYRSYVPKDVEDLLIRPATTPSVAVFYTIWSYKPGGGRRLITETRSWINQNRSDIREFVTLSPQTEMAKKFHLQNGAQIFRVNSTSVNYLYP